MFERIGLPVMLARWKSDSRGMWLFYAASTKSLFDRYRQVAVQYTHRMA